MLPLPKGYKPLTAHQVAAKEIELAQKAEAAAEWKEVRKELIATTPHEGDKRTCKACQLGL